MLTSYRILSHNGYDNVIEFNGREYAEEDLCDTIWLVNQELRSGRLPKREQIEAKRQIAQYGELLAALRSAGA
jgi:hypothetical protein